MNTITVTYQGLKDLLTPVLPHVCGDCTLPVLGCVSFEVRAGYLTATATDRYTIGMSRMAVDEGTEFTALVQAVELKALLAMFKPRRGTEHESLTLTLVGPTMRVEGAGALFSSAVIEYAVYEGEYPKVLSIFSGLGSAGTGEPFLLNGDLLAKFRLASRPGSPLEISTVSASKPVFITSGDHFLGAIMTARKSSDEPGADWSAILAAPAAAAVKA